MLPSSGASDGSGPKHDSTGSLRFDSSPHYSKVLQVKNTFMDLPAEGMSDSERSEGRASSDPLSKGSSRSSLEDQTPSVHPQARPLSSCSSIPANARGTQRATNDPSGPLTRESHGKGEEASQQSRKKKKEKAGHSQPNTQGQSSRQGFAGEAETGPLRKQGPAAARMLANVTKDRDHWSLKLPSMGSLQHVAGEQKCVPCFRIRSGICKKGQNCVMCHHREHFTMSL